MPRPESTGVSATFAVFGTLDVFGSSCGVIPAGALGRESNGPEERATRADRRDDSRLEILGVSAGTNASLPSDLRTDDDPRIGSPNTSLFGLIGSDAAAPNIGAGSSLDGDCVAGDVSAA